MSKRALIFGLRGQDGSYLSQLLLKKGYKVFGVSRSSNKIIKNLTTIKVNQKLIKIYKIKILNAKNVFNVIKKSRCDKIFFLSGITSVGYSIHNPIKTINTNTKYIFYILEACSKINKKIKIYNSISSECFGSKKNISEKTKFNPQSPYALSKTISFYLTKYYRDTFKLWISNGILFNHESYLRPNNFVVKKIIKEINKVKNSNSNKIILGNLNVSRDWGWAPEFVKYIYKISNLKKPEDFVIATGKTINIKELVSSFLKKININKKVFIIENQKFKRKNDIKFNSANTRKLVSRSKSKPRINSTKVLWKIYNKELF